VILFINWDVSAEIIDGWKTPNWYGLLFVTGMIIGYFVIQKMFKKENIDEKYLDKLVLFMVVGTILGARFGHVFFYGPYWDTFDEAGNLIEKGYFSHPMEMIKIWEGGLASHGAALVLLITLFYFSRKVIHKSYLWMLDRIAAPIAVAGGFIRMGNLMNHEIVGDPSDLPWAFSFTRYYNDSTQMFDPTPRHPAQLYEAICYFIAFGILMYLFWKKDAWKKQGVVFGTFLILIFGARFLVEFVKLGLTARDAYLPINTGQILSIPLVIAGVVILWKGLKRIPEENSTIS
jgi:prolipoprotein diacylglyceryl transferase